MIILFVLIILASMLFGIGLTLATRINSFYYDKIEGLNEPHVTASINSPQIDEIIEKIKTLDGIEKIETESMISSNGFKIIEPGEDTSISYSYVQNIANQGEISPVHYVEKSENSVKNAVSLPLIFRDTYNYSIDDEITLEINGKTHTYTVYGFFEEVYYGSPLMGILLIYLDDSSYDELLQESHETIKDGVLTNIRLNDIDQSEETLIEVSKAIKSVDPNAQYNGFDVSVGKSAATTVINILSMVMVGFSLIVVLIALIVSGFSITTAVEDDIQSIGILKALGYSSKQVVLAIVLQYGVLAIIGSALGTLISVFSLPLVGNIAAMSAGLLWEIRPSIVTILLSFLVVVGLVVLVAGIFAGKTKKITPISALRNGLETHNFKKNCFPLAKSKLNVNLSIVAKTIFSNVKQSISILVIIIFVGFASTFSMQIYTNLVEDSTAIAGMVGQPQADVWFISGEDFATSKTIFDEIAKMDEVEKNIDYLTDETTVWGIPNVGLNVSSDYSKVNRATVYEGRYPLHSNELAISGVMSDKLGKKVGDVVDLELYGSTHTFIITGLTEQMNNLGQVLDITVDGMKKFLTDYSPLGMLIDLKEGINVPQFISELQSKYTDYAKNIMDMELMTNSAVSSMSAGFAAAIGGILAIMVIVIALVLFLIIKIKILREKTSIGIYRSLGFTTKQLIIQIALSFTSIISVGAILGGIAGALFTNKLVSLLVSGIGVKNVHFVTNPVYLVGVVIGIIVLSFIVSCLVSANIKRITPYSLLVE